MPDTTAIAHALGETQMAIALPSLLLTSRSPDGFDYRSQQTGVDEVILPEDLELLGWLTAVQNGSYLEKAVPLTTLVSRGYVLNVDGEPCLSMLGLETVWDLRRRSAAP